MVRDILFMAFMTMFFLEIFCAIKLIVTGLLSKKYKNCNDTKAKGKHEYFKKMYAVAEVEFAVIMIVKVYIVSRLKVPFGIWLIDVILMGICVAGLFAKYVIRNDANQTQKR
ncbi:MAG TPA: hypothetical protein IAD08_05460 [Candidatus Scatovivens faecipullorum]|nr:hypothetical protein [Candidatus Scatovivens faecipullorum]